MPNQEKVKIVDQIKQDLTDSTAVWVVDYRGLSVKQAEDLRRKIAAEGAQYKIYKNTFTIRALQDLELPEMGSILEGPSGFVFTGEDPVAAAKILKQFAKENKQLSVKGGLFEGKVLSDKEVIAVADMPSREELIGQVIGMLSNPLHEVVATLDASNVIYGLLDAIEEKAA
ncbi:MAG: 50S ribosomal protein L10 [Coriobacteriia bacterium]|nr:50S ribosomal protein L10 [Coriobacteriia bacterium]MCL2750891.1 50S ribosomal protein L10 [Coriobacteriia bacterium]